MTNDAVTLVGEILHEETQEQRRIRYLKERELLGRSSAKSGPSPSRGRGTAGKLVVEKGQKSKPGQDPRLKEYVARVNEIRSRLTKLRLRLREIKAAASKKSKETPEKASAAEKSKAARDSKEYRTKNKAKIAAKAKAKSESKTIDDMNEDEVNAAIRRALGNLQKAMAKVKAASKPTG